MTAFLRRIWTCVRPYRGRLFLGSVCGIIYALTNGLLVVVIQLAVNLVFEGSAKVSVAEQLKKGPALNRYIGEHLKAWLPELTVASSRTGLLLVIGAIPAVMLVRVLFGYFNIYLMNWSAVRAVADLRTRLFAHLQDLPLGFFSTARTGDLISRITSDTQMLYSIIGNSLASAIRDPVTVLFLLLVLVSQEPTLTMVSIIVLPLCLVPMIIYGRKVRKSAKEAQTHAAELANLMYESFTGNRIIKAYNLEKTVVRQFKEHTGKYISQIMRVVRANEIPSQMMEFLGTVGVAMVFVYVVSFPSNSKTAGNFMAFIGSIFLMYQPIKSLTRLQNQLHQAQAATERVFELLQTASTVCDPPNPAPLRAAGADIHFQNIDFHYGEKPVLRGINLTVKAGQLVALVGKTGSGKTTLTNLLLRFYDPQRGEVRIGENDVRQVALADLRRQIALVAQETILFNDTIRKNIALGKPGATDAEIEAAAKHAYAHDFIREKPLGYDTMIGEKGVALSGGQRQRIAIARAILKDAPILVLDEATNALDAESERAVQKALEELMKGRTTICIAHRFSTIQKADMIVVLEQGRIAERGTHTELIERGGIYSKLFELQFEPAMVS